MYVFGSGWRRRVGGEWMRGLDLGFTKSVRRWGMLDMWLCLGCDGEGYGSHYQSWEVLTQFIQQFGSSVTAPPLVCCVVWSRPTQLIKHIKNTIVTCIP